LACLAGVGHGVASADSADYPATLHALPINQIASGTLRPPRQNYAGFDVTVAAGDYEAQAWGETPQGDAPDTVLYVYGPKAASGYQSRPMAYSDDADSSLGAPSSVRVRLLNGTYRIVVTTYRQAYEGTFHVVACPAGTCAKARATVPEVPDLPRAPG
jgi:hypothetical protein